MCKQQNENNNLRFKNSLLEYENAKKKLEKEKEIFEKDVKQFFRKKGIPVEVRFFSDSFCVDTEKSLFDFLKIPKKFPLEILIEFCEKFGCTFERTDSDGRSCVFSFLGINVLY